MSFHEDTIAAIATAVGPAGVGVIRLSGPSALAIAGRLLGRTRPLPPRRLVFGTLRDPRDGALLDEGFVCAMPGPRSYTGEDVAELQVHGGLRNLARLLSVLVACGARAAEAGEFTRRAVLNGRMDLTRAEALLDLIEAPSEAALSLAQRQRAGLVSEAVTRLAEALDGLIARVEADLDFPDEEETGADRDALARALAALVERVDGLAASYETGRVLREGFRVCLVGRPNAGKSSLFNALLGEDRAIVTSQPGTTRDFLEERIEREGLSLILVDTAGVVESRESAEQQGVSRAWRQVERADLVLLLVDGSESPSPADEEIRRALAGRPWLELRTKSDLSASGARDAEGLLEVSARSGAGLPELLAAIVRRALPRGVPEGDAALISRQRQRQALERCAESLRRAVALSSAPLEIVAADLRIGRRALAELVGALSTEDLLDRIFGEFCIGK